MTNMPETSRRTQPDYRDLIDAETWRFIERTDHWYPPGTTHSGIAEQRRIYDAMCREFHAGYPQGVIAIDDKSLISTRHYQWTGTNGSTATAQIIYFHGGGFIVGGLQSHDDICAELCHATGFPVTAVDYRLCPEHPHPAAFDDAVAGVRKAWQACRLPVILCGDSAGGNLAAAVAHHLRPATIDVIGQMLIYPGLGGDMSSGSYLYHSHAPMLTSEEVRFYASVRTGNGTVVADATSSPLLDSDYAGLPPTVIVSAECDPLSDDGRLYRDRILAAGGQAVWFNESGLVHGYLRARTTVSRARQSFHRIIDGLGALGNDQWPYASPGSS